MFPSKAVVLPRVAELPTAQYTLSVEFHPSSTTPEPLAVVSALATSMTMLSLLAPPKLRVRTPVNWADELKKKTPAPRVNPPRFLPLRLRPDKPIRVVNAELALP